MHIGAKRIDLCFDGCRCARAFDDTLYVIVNIFQLDKIRF